MTSSRQQPSEPPSDAGHHASSWEERYASVEQLWSGRPNNWLPELAVDWEPEPPWRSAAARALMSCGWPSTAGE